MEALRKDLKYGIQMLIKKPFFTTMVVLTLGLGIAANTSVFSVVNGVLFRPLPYKDADNIMTIWQKNLQSGAKRYESSPANFLDWQDQNQVFEELAAIEPWGFDYSGSGEPESINSWLVSADFFNILGVNALHGRTFLPEEYQPGNQRVVVLSYGLWRRRFGSDPNIVGQDILLRGQPYNVVGIMPADFQFPAKRDIWAPKVFGAEDKRRRGTGYLNVIARLKLGVTIDQAQKDADAIASRLAEQYPETNTDVGISVVPLPEQLVGEIRPALLVLLAAVGIVLLIGCANVANLLLALGTQRRTEFAIRASLGATPYRLIRQLITESALLAFIGGIAGILLATWGTGIILALAPSDLPRINQVSIDGRVLAFALGASALTAFVFGLISAIHFSKPDLHGSLKEGSHAKTAGLGQNRLRQALIVSQIALALILLISAGLLVHSFISILRVDPGFKTNKLLAFQVHVWARYRTPEERAVFFDRVLEQFSALPGVTSVGGASAFPLIEDSVDVNASFTIEEPDAAAGGHEATAYSTVATVEYFNTMGIPLVRGRFFTRFDNKDSVPVVLINETMARRYWGNEDPVGKKIKARSFAPAIVREIIGVVGDVRHTGLDSEPRPEYYVPHLQNPYGSMTFVVRTASDPLALAPAVKGVIWAANRDQPIMHLSTVEQLLSDSLIKRRFSLTLLGCFAVIASILAAVGVYGLISFSVSQRLHEIGIRIALGAQMRDILRIFFREAILLSILGVGIGLAGAFALTQVLRSMLFGITPIDPVIFTSAPILLIGIALMASYIPASKATRVDPVVALKYE